jgi:hypothetical protein
VWIVLLGTSATARAGLVDQAEQLLRSVSQTAVWISR